MTLLVVFLLRLNFLASAKRHAFLSKNMPDVYLLPQRPSFDGKGTDATDYAWFHWSPKSRGATEGKIRLLALNPKKVRVAK